MIGSKPSATQEASKRAKSRVSTRRTAALKTRPALRLLGFSEVVFDDYLIQTQLTASWVRLSSAFTDRDKQTNHVIFRKLD